MKLDFEHSASDMGLCADFLGWSAMAGFTLWLCAQFMYPMASAIDTELPNPPFTYHIFQSSKPGWVPGPSSNNCKAFDEYPDCSIEEWHRHHKLYIE